MGLFKEQGLHAASFQPFQEWCIENNVDLRVSAVEGLGDTGVRESIDETRS